MQLKWNMSQVILELIVELKTWILIGYSFGDMRSEWKRNAGNSFEIHINYPPPPPPPPPSHYLNQWWPDSSNNICGTRGRWVNKTSKTLIVYFERCHLLYTESSIACETINESFITLKSSPWLLMPWYRQNPGPVYLYAEPVLEGLYVNWGKCRWLRIFISYSVGMKFAQCTYTVGTLCKFHTDRITDENPQPKWVITPTLQNLKNICYGRIDSRYLSLICFFGQVSWTFCLNNTSAKARIIDNVIDYTI